MRHSTKRPTKAEADRIEAAKTGPCIPCLSWAIQGKIPVDFVTRGGDYDHKKSGNIRRGHMEGFCSCTWHHRRIYEPSTISDITSLYGPSLLDGSKKFRDAYGTDDELIELQTVVIERGMHAAIAWKREQLKS